MSRETNLTDRWVGNYFQHGRPRPISADLVQAGERLTGSMRDDETDSESSVSEVAFEAGLPPGGDEQIVDRLRRMFPDAPATPIRYVAHLPPDSALEGWVKGLQVYFLKAYNGTHYGGYQVGDKLVGFEKPCACRPLRWPCQFGWRGDRGQVVDRGHARIRTAASRRLVHTPTPERG